MVHQRDQQAQNTAVLWLRSTESVTHGAIVKTDAPGGLQIFPIEFNSTNNQYRNEIASTEANTSVACFKERKRKEHAEDPTRIETGSLSNKKTRASCDGGNVVRRRFHGMHMAFPTELEWG